MRTIIKMETTNENKKKKEYFLDDPFICSVFLAPSSKGVLSWELEKLKI